MKRFFDVVFSILGLFILSPILFAIAVAIKYDSKGSVLYRGLRVGLNKTQFYILKFRSMVENAESIGGSSSPDDDPRVTRMGRFLRRYKLDELPQLINVLKGEMSIVGPRPQVQWAVDLYTPEEQRVLSVRPGITDYASLHFSNEGELLRGTTDPDKFYMEIIHPQKMKLTMEYVKNRSLLLDVKIILMTIFKIMPNPLEQSSRPK